MPRIVHLTSAHPRHDTRIFVKQCRTMASHGHEVILVVADGLGDELRDGVRIVDVGAAHGRRSNALVGRLHRMLWATRRVAARALAFDADVIQLHDPELLPAGLRLRRTGLRVVFDAHEDVPTQLLDKPYLAPTVARLLARLYARYERHACARLDGLLAATPLIRERLALSNPHTVDVANYPLPDEFVHNQHALERDWEARTEVCYVGSISAIRGIREMVQACALLRSATRLALAGSFADPALAHEMALQPGWNRVGALGHLDRAGVSRVMANAFAGLVTLLPTVSYRDALPVKMFEYMAAGIPVIASDFPRWRAIIDASDCGLCVDPRDPAAIAAAIDRLAHDPPLARRLGANGRRAIEQTYNWRNEAQKLVRFYADLTRHPLARRLALT